MIIKIFKLSSIFVTLFVIPYLNLNIISRYYFLKMLLKITLCYLVYNINLFSIIKYSLIHLIYLIIYLYYYQCYNIKNTNYFTINLPYYLNISLKKKILIKYYIYLLPYYIKKMIYINIIYFIILKFLFTLIKNEHIATFTIGLYNNIKKFIHFNMYKYSITILFCFEFVEIIRNKLNYLKISILIKSYIGWLTYSYKYIDIFLKLIMTYLIILLEEINYTSSVLWNKQIYYQNFSIKQ
uniref:Uncharacterized protein n=1 Tax=Dasyclonium flaccidum TaxID=2007274 RepID=A0A1Z1MKL3_9FLOR|nr:hypothetical protein [Dasyclonium flaccidum]ARW66613.1 hypothetical protein [Dasyclonium flaccidum]